MSQVYSDYAKARLGWLPFGLTGWQGAIVAASSLPVFWSLKEQAWSSAAMFLLICLAVTGLTVGLVRGRSAIGWIVASTAFAIGGLARWTQFRARAAQGATADLAEVDLPGVLAGVEIHEGPPTGLAAARVAIIQDHSTRTWAVTAAIVHPGTGMRDADDRAGGPRPGRPARPGLRTELVDEILFLVRTVPEDGAERDQWIARHRRPDGPDRSGSSTTSCSRS
jgi:hypothetical protein